MGMVVAALLAAATAEPTLQQRFEAASAALNAGDYATAVAGFAEVGRLAKAPRTRAVAELRGAVALRDLGRGDEAAPALRHALGVLSADDATLKDDRFNAYLALGLIEEDRLDYAPARADDAAALALAVDPADGINARLALARVTMFTDPAAAVRLAGEADALAAADKGMKPAARGLVRTVRGRALLNAGRPQEALAELKAAVAELGGLSLKVDRADLLARSDLAIAALRSGDAAAARKYLAYSGSGLLDHDLKRGVDMDPPACGDEGLAPDDVAVVQFGIADDGHVLAPQPIYSSVGGDKALLFARAVAGWSWAPDSVRPIPPLFRSVLRVEVRCSTSVPRPGIDRYLRAVVGRWADDRGLPPAGVDASSAATALPLLRAELARREGAGDPARQFAVLVALADNPLTDDAEAGGWIARAAAIADQASAPPIVRAALAIRTATLRAGTAHQPVERLVGDLERLAADPAVAADPRAAAAVRLVAAERLGDARRRAQAVPLLAAVDADARLPRTDPLRQAAAARLSSVQAAGGQLDLARATFARSGQTAEQCALVDAAPIHTRGFAGVQDYPDVAREWGFSGWTANEFDIGADGTSANVRTIVGYPAFVFGPAINSFLRRTRYSQSFRPDGRAGCGGYRTSLGFHYVTNPAGG